MENNIKLEDKDYLNQILFFLKDLEKNYAVCLTESSNMKLYTSYFSIFKEIADMQKEVFEKMYACGFYKLESADKSKIKSKYTTLFEEFSNLNVKQD